VCRNLPLEGRTPPRPAAVTYPGQQINPANIQAVTWNHRIAPNCSIQLSTISMS
jgi:hypothetical protein